MTELETRIGRLRWRGRRGMKELDELFERYFAGPVTNMDEESITALERMMDCEDTELLDWLTGRAQPPDPEITRLVDLIRKH